MSRVVLVTGGARSGKSRYALERAMTYERRAFVATAVPFDAEMRRRIARHRAQRKRRFLTVEEPLDVANALRRLPRSTQVAVVDCLTVWMGNLMHRYGDRCARCTEIRALLRLLRRPPCDLILVTNEVGMGIVPDNALARAFRDMAGSFNQAVGRLADEVVWMLSGIPCALPAFSPPNQSPPTRCGGPLTDSPRKKKRKATP